MNFAMGYLTNDGGNASGVGCYPHTLPDASSAVAAAASLLGEYMRLL